MRCRQLGDGSTADRLGAVQVSGLEGDAAAISLGQFHTCAVTTSGGVKCWGDNSFGQLGNGDASNSSQPVDVADLAEDFVAVAAGGSHSCAVSTGGAVK